MSKLRLQISVLILVSLALQNAGAQNTYYLKTTGADRDSAFLAETIGIPSSFSNRLSCTEYINKLIPGLQARGYVTASLDNVSYDSASAAITIYIGEIYKWANLNTKSIEPELLDAVGWRSRLFANKPMDFSQLQTWQERMLSYLENNGYPFAKVYLDSFEVLSENDSVLTEENPIPVQQVIAQLKVDKGFFYKIDSIKIHGDARISNRFLQKYLDIADGSSYNREKLKRISKKIAEIPYVQEEKPSDVSMVAMGSILNLYLKPKRSSQVNVLVGFLPNNDQLSSKKLLVTGEANINLRNALGQGEMIGLNWQQLQVKSPRLNILYQHPYLFNTPVGLDFAFDMFRKDSAFVNVNLQIGALYNFSSTQTGKLFLQRFQTILSTVDTSGILRNKKLPEDADVSSVNVGIDYDFNKTDYRLNPRKGIEFKIIGSVGTKKIKKNNQVLELKDPDNPAYDFGMLYDTVKLSSYQFRVRATLAKYFPIGRQSTVKTAVNAAIFQSPNIFRNELFQIGGYKLLRGFDEESQYLSRFAIATAEYHYLIGLNSYFYVLADGGWGQNNSLGRNLNYTYAGAGLGLAFETKAGIFNLAWAIGKRSDTEFNLRQSKIHFGFVNYF